MNNDIELREIPDFPNYFAGSDGEIYSRNYKKKTVPLQPRRLRYGYQKSGYRTVILMVDNKRFTQRLHVLICTAFHGDRPLGLQCSHLDDNKENNCPDNLKWETDKQNKHRKYSNNGGDRGILNSRAIFTEKDVKKIRDLLKTKLTHQQIADEMNCSRTSISRIHNNLRYKDVM